MIRTLGTGRGGMSAFFAHLNRGKRSLAVDLARDAVTAALLARTRTGRGTRVDVSMLDVALAFLWPDGMMNHTVLEPERLLPAVARSFRTTPTADGAVVLVTLTSAQWSGLATACGDPDAGAAAGELTDTARRTGEGAAIMRAVRRRIAELPTAEVVRRLTEADVPCAPVVA